MIVQLGDVVSIVAKQVDPRLPQYRALPLINGENIESGTTRLLFRRTAADEGATSGKFLVATGDVVYSKLRPYLRKAVVAVEPGLCSADSYPLRSDITVLDPHWLAWMLVSDGFTRYASDASARARMPKLNREQLFRYRFEAPSVEAQRRIAADLKDQFEVVRRVRSVSDGRRELARSLGRTLTSAAFARQGEGFTPRTIGEVARIQTGYAFRSEWFRESGVRLLRNANVGHRRIYWSDSAHLDAAMEAEFDAFQLRVGDIVLSLDRPLVSSGIKVARLTEADVPSLLLQRVARLSPSSDVDAEYLFGFLLSSQFRASISGHDQSLGIPHVSPGQVGATEIPLPSIGEQVRIAAVVRERLAAIDALEVSIRIEQAAAEALPAELLHRSFPDVAA